MARMIPISGPREYNPSSKEGEIYTALNHLPDEFIVVHSLRLVALSNGALKDNEADFVIFNKNLGLLCIEAKAGRVSYSGGDWYYGNGAPMPHGGPFNQAANAKYRIRDAFCAKGLDGLLQRCRMHHAVWFPSISKAQMKGISLAPEAEKGLLLLAEDLIEPELRIREIMSIEIGGVDTSLTEKEADALVERILCPAFDLVPSRRLKYDLADLAFLRLLESQKRILDFLEDQRTAVINGVAGSGKTLIAVERARRLSEHGDKVLLLCYNAMLRDDLRQRCGDYSNVDVYTIAGYACKTCNSKLVDYEQMALKLVEYYDAGAFPYKHVIVDEGQDFGVEAVEQADILTALSELAEMNEGTFYLFYDKNQLIQGSGLPRLIDDADCKLTLYVNCRNTKNIAMSSINSLGGERRCITKEAATSGSVPKLFVSTDASDQADFINREIASLRADGVDDIVVLTCSTESKSALSGHVANGFWEKTKVPFYTCRKFKGLEADAVILVDVDVDTWASDASSAPYAAPGGLLFYTGASRARHELRIVCSLTEVECVDVLESLGSKAKRKPFQALAKTLNAKLVR
ncbi:MULTISPECIES: ATP-binding domain-containing protein [unclassified Adlercreutzia]|uniref:ATP-binding domain-containing protein n=1 Tax=unclassified Adlercreutzia TaxID=2636013 RepID=UPI0013EDC842|nr:MULTISPECIES: ATP-binding domain-containing protein [unclassified Adlercreutzia]